MQRAGLAGTASFCVGSPTAFGDPLAVLLLADAVVLELLVQVGARGADGGGGSGDVPAALAQLLDQEGALGGFLEVLERARGFGGGSATGATVGGAAQHVGQVLGADLVLRDHDKHSLDRV